MNAQQLKRLREQLEALHEALGEAPQGAKCVINGEPPVVVAPSQMRQQQISLDLGPDNAGKIREV